MSSYSVFKVIKIIDKYSIVINGGLSHSVSLDDNIEIFVKGDEVLDPLNDNAPLGTLDFIKETLKVTEIYQKFSVCQRIVEEDVYEPSSLERAVTPFGRGKTITVEHIAEIKVNTNEITGRKTANKTIEIGDEARIALSS